MDTRYRNDQSTADGTPEWRVCEQTFSLPAESTNVGHTLRHVVKLVKKILGERAGYLETTPLGFTLHQKGAGPITIADVYGNIVVDGMSDEDFAEFQSRMNNP